MVQNTTNNKKPSQIRSVKPEAFIQSAGLQHKVNDFKSKIQNKTEIHDSKIIPLSYGIETWGDGTRDLDDPEPCPNE